MKALITGGAGFIGSNLVKNWLSSGHEAVVLDNLSSGYKKNLFTGVPFVHGDIRDVSMLEEAMSDCDVVFNLAASVGNKRSIDDPTTDSAINIIGLVNVLEAARLRGIRKVVQSSSAGIFGELKTIPIDEAHSQEPDTPYGVSKLAGEKMCLAYNKLYGMENVCLRYFNVYGPNQRFDAYGNVIPIFATRALNGEAITIFGDGEQTRDFVHVSDVVAANIACALTPEVSGPYNIGSGTRVSINELARLINASVGTGVEVIHADPRPGDVRHSLSDINKAYREFSFVPDTRLDEGLEKYMQWLAADRV